MHRLHAFTLVSALLIGLSSFSPVVAAADVSPIHVARHGEHARMIKRYALVERQGGLGGIFPGDDDDDGPSASASATASSTSSSSTRDGILDGIPGIGGQTSTGSSSSTPTPSSTRSSSTSTTRSTTTRPPVESTTSTATSATARPTITVTSWEDATPEQKQQIEENREHQSTLSRIPPGVRTGLIAAAAVIGGLAIIWTAIRKWKLRSSRSFKDRLAPIEWEKNDEKSDTLPPPTMGDASDTASVRRNLFGADHHSNPSSLAPPAHDFTAGPGGFPYTRTPSPGPLRTASPGQFRTASPAQFRTASPAPMGAQGYNNNSDHGHGGYEQPRYGY